MDLAVVELGRSMASLHLSSSNQYSIDEDLWVDILKRLPSKTLVRFLCVCKSWKSLLSSPFFHVHHLNFFSSTTEINSYLLVQPLKGCVNMYIRRHHRDNTKTECVGFPVRRQRLLTVIGVLDGVVCIAYLNQDPFLWSPDSVYLWNPIIRKFIDFPWPFDLEDILYCNLEGLGFDISKNSFKVVLSPPFYQAKGDGSYYVFSVCEGVWRSKPLPDHVRSHRTYGHHRCFMNGSIHWITDIPRNYKGPWTKHYLLLFDCEHEEFRTMDLPPGLGPYHSHTLLVHDGLLQVFVSKGYCGRTSYEVWKMNNYGDATTWTIHQTVSYDFISGEVPYFMPKDESESDDVHQLQIGPKLSCMYTFVYKETMLLMDIGRPS